MSLSSPARHRAPLTGTRPLPAVPASADLPLAVLRASVGTLRWRPLAVCAATALIAAAGTGLSPRLAGPALLLALLALACAAAVAAEDPAADVAAVTPVGRRPRLAARSLVTALTCAAALAAVVLLVDLTGERPGQAQVVRWACLALLALAVGTLARRLWSEVPAVAAAAVVLGQLAVLEHLVTLPALLESAVWRSPAGRLGITATVTLAVVALATRDAAAPRLSLRRGAPAAAGTS